MSAVSAEYTAFDKARKYEHGSKAKERDEFEVDKGRIIHSGAFRRLQGKTQVLGVGERDFYRTRLTHSLEVAQIARGLCTELGGDFEPNKDLVEAICLAHDIGHSPFGHSGEDVLHRKVNEAAQVKVGLDQQGDGKSWEQLTGEQQRECNQAGFGANPQNLRVVGLLEAKFDTGGLDLTRATLDGLIKYPKVFGWLNNRKSKCYYASDTDLVTWVKDGIIDKSRTPIEGQLADWADQMAYSTNDIEDVVRAGLLSFTEMRTKCALISEKATSDFKQAREKRWDAADAAIPVCLTPKGVGDCADFFESKFVKPASIRDRKVNLKQWTSDTLKELKEGCSIRRIQNGEPSVRYQCDLYVPPEAEALSILLKKTAFLLVFSDPRVRTLEAKGALVIRELFDMFSADPKLLPLDWQEMITLGTYGSKERLISDFIAGMTDKYAYVYYSRLTQPGAGSFYEFV